MKTSRAKIYDLLFIVVLLVAAGFRFVGINWDQNQHLHPDERFMTMVESSMTPVKSLSDYFNTETSTLNPHNVGYQFYVYGDLPIIIVRYVAAWMTSISTGAAQYVSANGTGGLGAFFAFISQITNWAGYDEVALLGRALSGIADLGTVFLLYLIGNRIYGRKVALLAAAFSAVAVMQIQQSHFFTVDSFANFFMLLAVYFAVEIGFAKPRIRAQTFVDPHQSEEHLVDDEIAVDDETAEALDVAAVDGMPEPQLVVEPEPIAEPAAESLVVSVLRSAIFWNVVGFGIAVGAAVASKINAAPLVALLPVALLTRYFQIRQLLVNSEQVSGEGESLHNTQYVIRNTEHWQLNTGSLFIKLAVTLLVVGAFFSAVSFRVFQPYAFKGPGFFSVGLNQKWLDNIKEQQAQSTGDPDAPPSLQWARRSRLYSVDNIVRWGLGWPLGILALLGLGYMGLRMLAGEGKHFLLWSWTLGYLAWQSFQDNPTMRYQLPIYPLLALMAAWLALLAFERRSEIADAGANRLRSIGNGLALAMPIVGLLVLAATAVWAYAFVHIYMVDHSRVQATRWIYQNVPGPFNLKIAQGSGQIYNQPMSYQAGPITPDTPYDVQFTSHAAGKLQTIDFAFAVDPNLAGAQTVTVAFSAQPGGEVLSTATLTADFAPQADGRGAAYTLKFEHPVALEKNKEYFLHFSSTGSLQLSGVAPINETTWDDGLPLRMDGYDGYAGIYQGDHNFEMYWDDNADKLARFTSNLDGGDYVFISSNRQWGTTTRVPERYPLTIALYRNLIGCPPEKDVIWCYNTAKPGTFKGGALGYDLVQVFESFPTIGPWTINDQFADEAFTVYDHPKVLIFKKRADYNPSKVAAILSAVDLTQVVHLTPLKAASYRTLMLPEDKLKADQAGGTWSELFSYQAIQNKYPIVGLLIWYLAIALLGWATYFFLRLLLPGLPDRGYPLARISGLLLLAFFAWTVGSYGGVYNRLTIAFGYGLIIFAGLAAAWFKRDEVFGEIRSKAMYFLSVEGIFLAFFLIDLYIRFGNPDLWHPGKGGERPMDFAYLNAVIKSSSFPPYDPWFSGGYINYYYWGFVLVGTPIKLLGIVPSLAFNFVLPTLFAMLAIGGFSVVWNLVTGMQKKALPVEDEEPEALPLPNETPALAEDEAVAETLPAPEPAAAPRFRFPTDGLRWLSAIAGGAALVLLGNLDTVRMIYEGLQRMVVPTDQVNDPAVSIFSHLSWFIQGIPKLLSGQTFPYYPGDWYWIPSRAISTPSGSEITEFPLFTFLYSDLHAHMMALPLTVLVIAWALAVLMARNISRWSWLGMLTFGGLVIGALRPTNTWDFPTYLLLGSIVTAYAIFRYSDVGDAPRFGLPPILQRVFLVILGLLWLVGTSLFFYQPFANWFAQGYNSLKPWTELRSPINQYWSHWGFFLFILASWMISETIQWMASTPLSALKKFEPYMALVWSGLVLLVVGFVLLIVNFKFSGIDIGFNVGIAWLAVPLLYLALILLFRPGMPDVKRLVLFMIATGLAITIFVEVAVLDGDIGRMNTVFKFYLQVWVMFAISSAAAIGWMLSGIRTWSPGTRITWSVICLVLFACTTLFFFTGGSEKMGDRMNAKDAVPPTLDSINYMNYARYSERDKDMDLSQDFRAIRWIQDNVQGSPVLLEGAPAGVQYTWFSRYSIYTGLPTVVGWQWHQEQQRTVMPQGIVALRGQEAQQFYRTNDLTEAQAFLKKYDVRYIVVGQLERAAFPEGLAKFDEQSEKLWNPVYRDADTVIYQVVQ